MNILHVLSQFEVTGAEVYAVTLANSQHRRGHRVMLISDTLHVSFNGGYTQHPIGNRSYKQRFRTIIFLIKFIRKNRIHIIHAHSRAASWVCYLAAQFTRTAYISTVHGEQHIHVSSKAWNIYGNHIIVVCERLRSHLINDLGIHPKNIMHIPNGIDVSLWLRQNGEVSDKTIYGLPNNTPVIVFIGRLTGPKGDVARYLVSNIFPFIASKEQCAFYIIPGTIVPDDIPLLIDSVNKEFGSTIITLSKFKKDLLPFLQAADIVIGSGRVAMESLLVAKPTVAFGEAGYAGLTTINNFIDQCNTNFGDVGKYAAPDAATITNDLITLLHSQTNTEHQTLQTFIQKAYDVKNIEDRINKVYRSAYAAANSPATIPILIYHRVIPRDALKSRHGIYVFTDQFQEQMRSLKHRGFTTITFEYYQRFLKGETNLPERPILITFDDGYQDNYEYAFPILQDYNFQAVIFSITNWERRSNFWDSDEAQVPLLTKSQIIEMSRAGIEFGSHTINHRRPSECSEQILENEIAFSRNCLGDLLGKEIVSFAYPYGEINSTVKTIVHNSGYSFGIAVNSGPHMIHNDFYEIRRTQIFPWTDRFGFWKKTQPWYVTYKQIKASKKSFTNNISTVDLAQQYNIL